MIISIALTFFLISVSACGGQKVQGKDGQTAPGNAEPPDIITGPAKGNPVPPETDGQTQIPGQGAPDRVMVDPGLRESTALNLLQGTPGYFTAVGWVDENRIAGMNGDTLAIMDLSGGKSREYAETAWWARISPNGKWVAYRHENGISLLDIEGGHVAPAILNGEMETHEAPDSRNMAPVDALWWAPGSDRLLCAAFSEWDSSFYLLEISTSMLTPLKTALEDYFLSDAVGWLDSDTILFTTRASARLDGSREYSYGYRQDLAIYDLKQEHFRLITNVPDGVFLNHVQILEESKAFYLISDMSGAADTAPAKERWEVLDTKSGKATVLEFGGNPSMISMNPDGSGMICVYDAGNAENDNSIARLTWRGTGGETPLGTLVYSDSRTPIAWSPSGGRAVFSLTARQPDSGTKGSYTTAYKTFLVERLTPQRTK